MKTISLHILDIFQNSIRAGASEIGLTIGFYISENRIDFEIRDNGCGMDAATLERLIDPFFTSRTSRNVGLGIPLLHHNALLSGGDVAIESLLGKGTSIKAWFEMNHWDRPPLGDVGEIVALLISGNPSVRVLFEAITDIERYTLDSREIEEILDGIEINSPQIVLFLNEMIRGNLEFIGMKDR